MNSYAAAVRVGVAGATGYTGVELLRLLSRHPGVQIAAAMGSPGAAPRYVPSLKSLWDAPVNGLDVDALADATDAIFLALPEHAAAAVKFAGYMPQDAPRICREPDGAAIAGRTSGCACRRCRRYTARCRRPRQSRAA